MRSNSYCDYTRIEKIGEGAYGLVYKVLHNPTGQIFAMKQIPIDKSQEGVPSTALREVSILREIQHPNVVSLFEVIIYEQRLSLVLEHMDSDMKRYVESLPSKRLQPSEVQSFVYQMCQALYYIHRMGIGHRDLKPQNLLIDRNGRIKLADFGLGRRFGIPIRAYSAETVTLWYRPPEILLCERRYTVSVDIWSAACIFAEFSSGSVLFPGDSEINQLIRIFRILSTPTEKTGRSLLTAPAFSSNFPVFKGNYLANFVPQLNAQGLDLLQEMLLYDPVKRITAREIIRHPYFSDLDKSRLPDYRSINRFEFRSAESFFSDDNTVTKTSYSYIK